MFGALLQKTWNGIIAPFFQFWLPNFGLWIPLALALVGLIGWRIWKSGWRWVTDLQRTSPSFSPIVIFAVGYFVKTAPWDWDNLKLMVWGYFLILLFYGATSLVAGPFRNGQPCCVALSGPALSRCSVDCLPDTRALELIERARLDNAGAAIRPLPVEARFAAYPTFNQPVLLQGRKAVLGYPGHLWTEGFNNTEANNRLTAL